MPSPRKLAPAPLRILVVEDDARLGAILARHLERLGHAVRRATDGEAALRLLAAAPADVVLSDVRMPGMDGRALLAELRVRHPATRVVLMTAFGEPEDAEAALRAGAYAHVTKPFKVEALLDLFRAISVELARERAAREAPPPAPPAPAAPTASAPSAPPPRPPRRGPLRRVADAGLAAARGLAVRAIVGLPVVVFVAILLVALVCAERAHPVMLDVDPAAVHALRPHRAR
jgi:CheY-like chemotaxis protein